MTFSQTKLLNIDRIGIHIMLCIVYDTHKSILAYYHFFLLKHSVPNERVLTKIVVYVSLIYITNNDVTNIYQSCAL